MMANRRRGEVALALGPERYTLCFTLGALAELEDALGATDLADLATRFAAGRLRSRDLVALLGAALRGGGHALDDAAVAALPLAGDLDTLAEALGAALAAAFGEAPAASYQEAPAASSKEAPAASSDEAPAASSRRTSPNP